MEDILNISEQEQFAVCESSLDALLHSPQHISRGLILLCLSGNAKISVNFESCMIEKYTQVFVLPQSIITIKNKSEDFRTVCFFFSDSMMDEACFRIDSELFGFLVDNFMHKFTYEIFRRKKELMKLVLEVYEDKENKFREKMAVNYLQNYFLDTLDKVYHHLSGRETKEAGRKNVLFKKFVRCVHKNYIHTRDVNFYASELNISTRYLSAITQAVDNSTAKDFIDNCVIQEIKFLLINKDFSIQEIADRLNFTDQSNLGRFFKSKIGISPSEYRKNK